MPCRTLTVESRNLRPGDRMLAGRVLAVDAADLTQLVTVTIAPHEGEPFDWHFAPKQPHRITREHQ